MVRNAPNLDLLLPKQEAGEENTSQVRKKSWIHSPAGQSAPVSTLDGARYKKNSQKRYECFALRDLVFFFFFSFSEQSSHFVS